MLPPGQSRPQCPVDLGLSPRSTLGLLFSVQRHLCCLESHWHPGPRRGRAARASGVMAFGPDRSKGRGSAHRRYGVGHKPGKPGGCPVLIPTPSRSRLPVSSQGGSSGPPHPATSVSSSLSVLPSPTSSPTCHTLHTLLPACFSVSWHVSPSLFTEEETEAQRRRETCSQAPRAWPSRRRPLGQGCFFPSPLASYFIDAVSRTVERL